MKYWMEVSKQKVTANKKGVSFKYQLKEISLSMFQVYGCWFDCVLSDIGYILYTKGDVLY